MIGGVTCQGMETGLPDRVTLSAGFKFCHVTFQGGVTCLAGLGFHDTSNSHKIHFGFAALLKATIESHITGVLSKSSK